MFFHACDGQGDSLINERLEDNPLPVEEVNTGTADFSTFIAIGASYAAGYADGALYNDSQLYSIPNLIASQVGKTVEGFTFNQPDINSVDGFNTTITNPANNIIFGRYKLDTSIPGPSPTIDGDAITPYSGPQVHNFGVPGIASAQYLTPLTGGPADPMNPAYSPYYERFASNPGTSTILEDALAVNPTFFFMWAGHNDVFGYAVSAASNEAILTSVDDYTTQFNAIITTLMTGSSADGVVTTIPPFLGAAYFQAVTWNAIALDEATATAVNTGLAAVNGAIQGCSAVGVSQEDIDQRLMSYSAGNNPILVVDEELDDLGACFDALEGGGAFDAATRAALIPYEQSRPLVADELVVISAGSVLGTAFGGDPSASIGVVIPLGFNQDGSLSGDQYYLSLAEQFIIETTRATFNGIIAAAVDSYSDRIALYDTNDPDGAFFDMLGLSDGVPGITVEGVNLEPDFSPNGILSTDGLHVNPKGAAILANEVLGVIEDNFGAVLPSVNVTNLPSVVVCGTGDCLSEQ